MAQYATIWIPQETIFDDAWLANATQTFLLTLVHYVPGYMTKGDLLRTILQLGPGQLAPNWVPLPGVLPCPYFADQTRAPFFADREAALEEVMGAGEHHRIFPITIPRRTIITDDMLINPIPLHPNPNLLTATIAEIEVARAVAYPPPPPPPQTTTFDVALTPKGRTVVAGVCGVRTDSFDPSVTLIPAYPPHNPAIVAGQQLWACARCSVLMTRPVDIKRHFARCVRLHGNPLGRYWDSDASFDFEI